MEVNENKKSVLVVGGGIAGIQASLDLANKGIKVFLVEKEPSIGGNMAKLDKTFPTNDCSLCILAPKMNECNSNENIDIISYSEVINVRKNKNKFAVEIKKKSRFIDEFRCNGCGKCAEICPVDLPNEFDLNLSKRKAVYKPFPQSVPNVFRIDKRGIPPCVDSCPSSVNVQGYIALISKKKFKEAYELILKSMPFPGICGRICHRPCESKCSRSEYDQPLSIAYLKRFVADYFYNNFDLDEITLKNKSQKKEKKVAIIGSGPAGLTCAYFLAKMGYNVTVFEKLGIPGGMLATGIPEYRLPRTVLNKEIELIKNIGVIIKYNLEFGKDFDLEYLKKENYRAVFIGIGAHKPIPLRIPGEDLDGVFPALSFLKSVNLKKNVKIGKRVVIIGGGNAAIDSARSAIRIGADEVIVLYRRSKKEMPAIKTEVKAAEEEGIKFIFLGAPIEIIGNDNKVSGIKYIRMRLGKPDESGRRRPIPIKYSERILEVDNVITAIGQKPDISKILKDSELIFSERDTFLINPLTFETNIPGVFAGGDAVTGPATAIEAIAAGKKAAFSINQFLERKKPIIEYQLDENLKRENIVFTEIEKKVRKEMPLLKREKRISTFLEVEKGYSMENAVAEAERCMNCGGCSSCGLCETVCEANAINYSMKDKIIELKVDACILATGFDTGNKKALEEYGYGKIKNVIRAIEFERILSASGPTNGALKRPSDGKIPEKIAFIQCVGSRDERISYYCSSVCCMHATKEAILAYEHNPEIQTFIFYTDLRAVGKGFQDYIKKAQNNYNVCYIRSRPGKIFEKNGKIIIRFEDTMKNVTEEMALDMVVLCEVMFPMSQNVELAEIFGIKVDKGNFFIPPYELFYPVDTENPGVFSCGFCNNPQDIPESVIQASASAARVSEYIFKVKV